MSDKNAPPPLDFDGLPLAVNVQYIKDLSFENPDPIKTFSMQKPPELAFNVDVQGKALGENNFEVDLMLRVEATYEKEKVYLLEIAYAGIFTINAPEAEIKKYLLVDCPRLLFPFARSIVTQIGQDASVGAINLPIIDFYKLAEKELTAGANASADGAEKPTVN